MIFFAAFNRILQFSELKTTVLLLKISKKKFACNTTKCRIIFPQCFVYHQHNNYDYHLKQRYSILQQIRRFSSVKKENIQIKAAKGREILKDVIEKKREFLIEKKNVLVKDIREKKTKVKEKVENIIERENILTIPNLLTVSRGLLAPYLGYIIIQEDYTIAMGLLVIAGISDLLDGKIARYWPQQASKFGSFLDPLADKLLVGSLVISLGYCSLLPIWLSGMILFRDASLISAGFVIRYISLPPPKTLSRYFDATHATAQLEPTFISKVNTAVQLLTIGLSLGAPIWNYVDHPLLHGLWYLTGVTTAAAAISYLTNKNTFKVLKNSSKGI